MKNLKRLLLWSALPLLLAGGVGLSLANNHDSNPPYLTAKVERGDVEDTVSALGTLQPLQYVDVGTQVTGQLKILPVSIGKEVRKGELVAQIDPILFSSKVETTEASLAYAKAMLSDKIVQQRLAAQQYARNNELYRSDAVSEDALQQTLAAVEQAKAQGNALRAQVKQYQAQLKGDEANLRYTNIYAPISGTVVSLTAHQGQTLVSNQQAPTILRIADLNTMTVWAQVSEADVPRITEGMPVYFATLGLPNQRWHSKVRQVLPTPENVNNVILYDVLFDVADPKHELKPQMSAQTSFVVAKAKNTLVVPTSALQASGKHHKGEGSNGVSARHEDAASDSPQTRNYIVRVLKQDGKIEERQVKVGVMSRTKAEILSGLTEDEEVVIGVAGKAEKKNGKSTIQSAAGKL